MKKSLHLFLAVMAVLVLVLVACAQSDMKSTNGPKDALQCKPDEKSACGLPSNVVIDMSKTKVQRSDAERFLVRVQAFTRTRVDDRIQRSCSCSHRPLRRNSAQDEWRAPPDCAPKRLGHSSHHSAGESSPLIRGRRWPRLPHRPARASRRAGTTLRRAENFPGQPASRHR